MNLARTMIFAKDMSKMIAFYRDGLGLRFLEERSNEGWAEFDAGGVLLALHAIPPEIATDLQITTPKARESTPIKLVFASSDVSEARAHFGCTRSRDVRTAKLGRLRRLGSGRQRLSDRRNVADSPRSWRVGASRAELAILSDMPHDWDARTYDRIADPQARWGRAVLDRLPLSEGDRVLDAGCGTGRVTELLLARVPRGPVVAVDASPLMLEEARRRLGEGPRIQYVLADLAQPLPVSGHFDAILSTATFHWIPITMRCSGIWRRFFAPEAGWLRSVVATETSSRCTGRSVKSMSTFPGRRTSPPPRRRASGSSRPGSWR